ncbi:uncharacterized protein BCR38DRAFT_484718 [Pseudomassariella vexata]|uniref:Uncharacterized protein n=1 Tax=Pseudomassariella vexata TaxID=1141098 RepID=A0A1Y2E1B5_9PEZI|nr:uncharacterized protein BCR38DRAFT_484718 [Pseudomassariella vexata]ORY65279.1 hypothetical protein BCR38DRAFT_484718 [Pseudomassariella vexata]
MSTPVIILYDPSGQRVPLAATFLRPRAASLPTGLTTMDSITTPAKAAGNKIAELVASISSLQVSTLVNGCIETTGRCSNIALEGFTEGDGRQLIDRAQVKILRELLKGKKLDEAVIDSIFNVPNCTSQVRLVRRRPEGSTINSVSTVMVAIRNGGNERVSPEALKETFKATKKFIQAKGFKLISGVALEIHDSACLNKTFWKEKEGWLDECSVAEMGEGSTGK